MTDFKTKIMAGLAVAAMASALPISAFSQDAASILRFSPLPDGYVLRARTMSDNANYAATIDQLSHLVTQNTELGDDERQEVLFLLAKAYYERGDSKCLSLLQDFVASYPASTDALQASLAVGDFYFFAHNWTEALDSYGNIDFRRLNRSQLPMYQYRKGLSLIKCGMFDEAKPLMTAIASDKEYADASKFYLAYIAYMKGDYTEAWKGFSEVNSRPSKTPPRKRARTAYTPTGLEAGYYLLQMEYSRKDYADVVEHGRSLLAKQPVEDLIPGAQRVIGLSFFKLGDLNQAEQYLRDYLDTAGTTPDAEAVYAMGVIDYSEGEYESARSRMSMLTDLNNALSQSAWLYLGQCAVKEGSSSEAAIAFEKAAKMNFDAKVAETALYNYAAAVTRGGNVPFASSAPLLERFVADYPSSEYAPKVEEYLATAYYNDKNYPKALDYISRIKRPSASVLDAKQMVMYQYGVELMTSDRTDEAVTMFEGAVNLNRNKEVTALSALWLGDARYALGQYAAARRAYESAISNGISGDNKPLARYGLAYSEYMQDNYSAALKSFAEVLKSRPSLPTPLANDARIRLADCRYYTGDYRGALADYNKAIDAGATDSDYATYRKAVMTGLGGDTNSKLSILSSMQSKYAGSRWLSAAMMEEGLTYESLGQTTKAAEAFSKVSRNFPESSQARKATLNMALAYMTAGNAEKAVEAYKDVIRKWPASQEAGMANDDLKKYYSSIGELRAYADFLKGVPGARQLDATEIERLEFEGAETAFAENADAVSLLKKYVASYPDGKYLAPALLDIASTLRDNGDFEGSLEAVDNLIAKRKFSPQYPEALLIKAEILEEEMPSRRADALATYRELEKSGGSEFAADACLGIMRTTDNATEQLEYARKATASGLGSAALNDEAAYYEAKALDSLGKSSEATAIFSRLAENPASEAGAMSAVTIAERCLARKDYAGAEKAMLKFTDAGTPHQYWLARGFIALADAYSGLGKNYMAKEYLESLRDNYPGDEEDIRKMITVRLKNLK